MKNVHHFIGDELEIMCHRAVLNFRKINLERDINEYSALLKYARPEMEAFKTLISLIEVLVNDLNDINEKLKEAI
jgi:hypothetical protein